MTSTTSTGGTSVNSTTILAYLPGRNHIEATTTDSTVEVAAHKEMLYVLSSFNILQSADVSLAIPCGRLMDFLRDRFDTWSVPVGSSVSDVKTLLLAPVGVQRTARWKCTTSKQVIKSIAAPGAILTKYSSCCSVGGGLSKVPCCVEKMATMEGSSKATIPNKLALQIELGAM
jgi:hypothetical protein